MNEGVRIDAWIVAKLQADTTVGGLFYNGDTVGANARVSGLWSERIPPEEQLPAVRFSDLSPRDVGGVNRRILITGLYLVAGVARTADYGDLVKVSDRIDALLERASGLALDGVTVQSCVRESVFRIAEDDGDVHYRHLGGLYRILASA